MLDVLTHIRWRRWPFVAWLLNLINRIALHILRTSFRESFSFVCAIAVSLADCSASYRHPAWSASRLPLPVAWCLSEYPLCKISEGAMPNPDTSAGTSGRADGRKPSFFLPLSNTIKHRGRLISCRASSLLMDYSPKTSSIITGIRNH